VSDATAQVNGGGRFRKTFLTAIEMCEGAPRVGVVATTPTRADHIRQVCLHAMTQKGEVTIYVDDEASEKLAKNDHDVIVLDSSLPLRMRQGLTRIAKTRRRACTVIHIKKWSTEPPA